MKKYKLDGIKLRQHSSNVTILYSHCQGQMPHGKLLYEQNVQPSLKCLSSQQWHAICWMIFSSHVEYYCCVR